MINAEWNRACWAPLSDCVRTGRFFVGLSVRLFLTEVFSLLFSGLRQDIAAIRERDPAARSDLEVLLFYPGLHALMLHRPAHWLYRRRLYFFARMISQFSRFLTNIEIHPGAQMGRGIFIDHGAGVVIGETAVVGDGCTIYQGVTLGSTGKECGKRHPTLGKNVLVGAGARILGSFHVGDNSKIAANAVLLGSVEENATAVGIPARVVRTAGEKTTLSVSDVPQELLRLRIRTEALEQRLDEVKNMIAPKDHE